jgi:hypothetical protein
MFKRSPQFCLVMLLTFFFLLQIPNTGYSAGQNVTTQANNILLNAFRTVNLTDLHVTGTKFNLIQDGVVDFFSTGDPFTVQSGFTADLIPPMTSNTVPSGVASASAEGGVSEKAWNAMANDAGGSWQIYGATTGWLRYDFPSPKTIEKYTVMGNNFVTARGPKDWTFEGSNDGINWTVLDTQTGITWVLVTQPPNDTKEFTFSNTTAYSSYRINVSAIGGGTIVNITEFEMMESNSGPDTLASSTIHTLTAETEPDECHLLLFEEDGTPVVLNQDLVAYCSRDGGTNWTEVPLADEGKYDGNKRMLTGTARFSDPSTGGKKDMVYWIERTNGLNLNLHGVGFEWN